jgi:hypothetical protein
MTQVATYLTLSKYFHSQFPIFNENSKVFSYGVVVAELITGKKPGVDLWIRTPDNCFDINPDELRSKALPGMCAFLVAHKRS